MARRIHVPRLEVGEIMLEPAQAHHARDVLRLTVGDGVELFNDAGMTADGIIARCTAQGVTVTVTMVRPPIHATFRWSIASAIPKAARADWMIEKLSELGTDTFIPLITARSVVTPEGKNKLERWERLATEAARQSRRNGVMRITAPMALAQAITDTPRGAGWHCSTALGAKPIMRAMAVGMPTQVTLFIGPEGGWTEGELSDFASAAHPAITLGTTILRVETAAIAAAALMAAMAGDTPL